MWTQLVSPSLVLRYVWLVSGEWHGKYDLHIKSFRNMDCFLALYSGHFAEYWNDFKFFMLVSEPIMKVVASIRYQLFCLKLLHNNMTKIPIPTLKSYILGLS